MMMAIASSICMVTFHSDITSYQINSPAECNGSTNQTIASPAEIRQLASNILVFSRDDASIRFLAVNDLGSSETQMDFNINTRIPNAAHVQPTLLSPDGTQILERFITTDDTVVVVVSSVSTSEPNRIFSDERQIDETAAVRWRNAETLSLPAASNSQNSFMYLLVSTDSPDIGILRIDESEELGYLQQRPILNPYHEIAASVRLGVSGDDLVIFDTQNLEILGHESREQINDISYLEWSPLGSYLVVANDTNETMLPEQLQIWDTTGAKIAELPIAATDYWQPL
jgi:hypothetical protein